MDFRINSRGMRNNNPGNIRHGSQWIGLRKEQTDDSFCQFNTVEYGIRALFKLLNTYEKKYDTQTIAGIIERYAPRFENATATYINTVYAYMMDYANQQQAAFLSGNKAHSKINDPDLNLKPLFIGGIIMVENGFQPFHHSFIEGCQAL